MPASGPIRLVACLGLCACLLPAGVAQNLTLKKRPPPPLTRAELRVCMDREDVLKGRATGLEKMKQQHDADLVALTSTAKELAESLRTLDASDHAAVDAHNERARQHDEQVDAHNKRTEAYNEAIRSLNTDTADMLAACSTRPYMMSDKDAILAERKKARAGAPPPSAEPTPAAPEHGMNGRGTRI